MSDLAIYQAPTFRVHELAIIHVQGVALTVRVMSGEQDLESGSWTYLVSLKQSYDDIDRYNDGEDITNFRIGRHKWGGIETPMYKRPIPVTVTHDGD